MVTFFNKMYNLDRLGERVHGVACIWYIVLFNKIGNA